MLALLRSRVFALVVPMLVPLLAQSASSASFTAQVIGAVTSQSVVATINVADRDVGKQGSIYLGALVQGQWYLNDGFRWLPLDAGPLPVYSNGVLANRKIIMASSADLSGYLGV
jgi:hypothetical protein